MRGLLKIIGIASISLITSSPVYSIGPAAQLLKPERRECIVKVILGPQPIDKQSWEILTSAINKEFMATEFLSKFPDVAQLSMPRRNTSDDSAMYLQYTDHCGNRIEMTKELMIYFSNRIVNFPNYEILEKKINPSPKTIDACGKYWSDCDN
jgi:hypothetical protein